MDYPKSVPSVGLVNGKFVDEDQGAGTPGSLIPSAWGNALTDEILAVISDAGLEPDEENHGQLKEALNRRDASATATQAEAEEGTDNAKRMTPLRVFQAIAKVVKQATESAFGWAKLATQAQVTAGTDDSTIVTPKKMRFGFSAQLSSVNGYLFLPTWLGGFCFIWGGFNVNKTTTTVDTVVAFPMAFPNSQFMAIVQSYTGVANGSGMNDAVLSPSASGFTYRVTNTSGNYPAADFRYFCIGN